MVFHVAISRYRTILTHMHLYPYIWPASLPRTISETEICHIAGTFSQPQRVWGKGRRKRHIASNTGSLSLAEEAVIACLEVDDGPKYSSGLNSVQQTMTDIELLSEVLT